MISLSTPLAIWAILVATSLLVAVAGRLLRNRSAGRVVSAGGLTGALLIGSLGIVALLPVSLSVASLLLLSATGVFLVLTVVLDLAHLGRPQW